MWQNRGARNKYPWEQHSTKDPWESVYKYLQLPHSSDRITQRQVFYCTSESFPLQKPQSPPVMAESVTHPYRLSFPLTITFPFCPPLMFLHLSTKLLVLETLSQEEPKLGRHLCRYLFLIKQSKESKRTVKAPHLPSTLILFFLFFPIDLPNCRKDVLSRLSEPKNWEASSESVMKNTGVALQEAASLFHRYYPQGQRQSSMIAVRLTLQYKVAGSSLPRYVFPW